MTKNIGIDNVVSFDSLYSLICWKGLPILLPGLTLDNTTVVIFLFYFL